MDEVKIRDVMIKKVYTIGPEEKIALARLKMLRYGVGALPVVKEDNTLMGMLTLRDISLSGINIGNLQVKDLMTKNNLITGTESTKLIEIIDMMSKTGIQRIPIIDAVGKLIGLMTQSVLIRSFRFLVKYN
jgi:IMP dehydrogenase